MKNKERKSNRGQPAASSAVDGIQQEQRPGNVPMGGTVIEVDYPPPGDLLLKARGEAHRRLVEEYYETICVLRSEKGFSFREIGDWLTENGVDADYNSVYRVYTKGMSEDEKLRAAGEDAEQEQEEERNL